MIGIPILDSLNDQELVDVINRKKHIRIPIPEPLEIDFGEPKPAKPIKEMPQHKIITLCKMEASTRLFWLEIGEKLQSTESVE